MFEKYSFSAQDNGFLLFQVLHGESGREGPEADFLYTGQGFRPVACGGEIQEKRDPLYEFPPHSLYAGGQALCGF